MTAILAYVGMTTGRPTAQCTAVVRPDEAMGWEAEIIVTQKRLGGVTSALSTRAHRYTSGHDSVTGLPRILTSLGNLSVRELLRRLPSIMPNVDRNLPELLYWLGEMPEDESTAPDLAIKKRPSACGAFYVERSLLV